MISPNDVPEDSESAVETVPPDHVVLVRYGVVPQVARFGLSSEIRQQLASLQRHGLNIVVDSDRGLEVAQLLEIVTTDIHSDKPVTGDVVRVATADDVHQHSANRRRAELEFFDWQQRADRWQLQLQIIDAEWTLDEKQIVLYVLNDQNAETTRLALLAAAAGLGVIHVQPVSVEGVVRETSGGGCGSGGCGSGGCS